MSETKPKYEDLGEIRSIEEYVRLIEEKIKEDDSTPIYRGHFQKDWNLLSSCARSQFTDAQEKEIFTEFRRMALQFPNKMPSDANEWDYLSIAQHHGLPTRLLDWTQNALTALWFSVEPLPISPLNCHNIKYNMDGAVWILEATPNDFVKSSDDIDPFGITQKSKIYRPRFVNPRIIAQSSVFVAHAKTSKKGFIPLEKNTSFNSKLKRILISHSARVAIRKKLAKYGISNATMFPDIDGLCRHLAFLHQADKSEI